MNGQEGIDWEAFLAGALGAGVTALEFWRMTPGEVCAAMQAANGRARSELKRSLYQAWYTAALTRIKRMMSLKKLIRDDERPPDDMEQLAREHEEMVRNSRIAGTLAKDNP